MIIQITDKDLRELLCARIKAAEPDALSYIGESILGTPVGSLDYVNPNWNLMLEEEDDALTIFQPGETQRYNLEILPEISRAPEQQGDNDDGSI